MRASELMVLAQQGRVQCLKGTLLAIKYHPDRKLEQVEGVGLVKYRDAGEGLIVPILDGVLGDNFKAIYLVVIALGEADPGRFGWTWADQALERGTIIAINSRAGLNQSSESDFLQVRQDEIAVIGELPAPGWVLVQEDDTTPQVGNILVSSGALAGRLESKGELWGTVLAVAPDDPTLDGLGQGDRVAIPYRVTGGGATEFLTFDGGIRAVPTGDVLCAGEQPVESGVMS